MNSVFEFILNLVANVASYFVCKWLDKICQDNNDDN